MRTALSFLISFLIAPLTALATVVPQDLHSYPDRMVRVSSVIYDYGQRNVQKVEGVGSVILVKSETGSRYFVLTAGHVSSGDSLMVETGRHKKYPVKSIYHDAQNDLSLIEIDSARIASLTPLAVFKEGELVAPFFSYRNVNRSETGVDYLLVGSKPTDVFPADDADGFSVEFKGDSAIACQAPWLPLKSSYVGKSVEDIWMRSSGNMLAKYRLEAPTKDRKYLRSSAKFPKGQSGTPILIPYNFGADGYYRYVLSGVLTTSADNTMATALPGPQIINSFMAEGLAQIGKGEFKKPVWFMINGQFIKATDKLEAYVLTGPVGNGVVIDGYVANEEMVKGRFEKDLREKGISETQVNDLGRQLTELNKALSLSDGERANKVIPKQLELIKSAGNLVH